MTSSSAPTPDSTHTSDFHKHMNSTFSGGMAKNYNNRTGGCNIRLARVLIEKAIPRLHLPDIPHGKEAVPRALRILDNACGPLVQTTELLQTPSLLSSGATGITSLKIDAVDLSQDFVNANKETISKATLPPRTTVDNAVMDGQDLSAFADGTFDASFTCLALFAFPDPVRGASELLRTLKPDGVALVTTWKHVGWLPLLHAVEDAMTPPKQHTSFPMVEAWMPANKLKSTLVLAGFKEEDVTEEPVMAEAWWDSMDKCADSFSETLRMMVGQAWTEGEKEGMREGFLALMREGEGKRARELGMLFEDGEKGKVGTRMEAWLGVAVKR